MVNQVKLFFGVFFLCLAGANSAFGDAVFFYCSPTTLTLGNVALPDTCPAVSGLPAGSAITGINVYLLADFQGGASIPGQQVLDSIKVLFHPLDDSPWQPTSAGCNLSNEDVGTIATSNTCGFYSGNLNAPETTFLSATSDLDLLAAGGFVMYASKTELFGQASTVTAGNIVEYDYSTANAVPEPSSIVLLFGALGGLSLAPWRRRHS